MIRTSLRPLARSLATPVARAAPRRAAVGVPAVSFVAARYASTNVAVATNQASNTGGRIAMAGVTALALGLSATVYAKDEPTKVDYQGVRNAIIKIIDDNNDMGPTLVRLAWHSSGTYDKLSKTGGSNGGTIRFEPEILHGANAGIIFAVQALEPVKKAFPEITYADLYTFAGVVAIEEMGGPKIAWRAGRSDAISGKECPPEGRLPNADKGTIKGTIQHIRDIFYRMGFNDREIVALIGAHALGRAHRTASGYNGPWTRAPTTFSNEFFRELLENKWTLKRWDGPDQFEDPTGDLMMLPADMALLWDKEFRALVEEYAKDEAKFFEDFAKAFQKLEELGVNFSDDKKGWWPF